MKKLIAFCLALFATVVVYAQKPLNVAVYENMAVPQPADNDMRTSKLLQEYLKSELATHCGIDVVQNEKINDKLFYDKGFRRGKEPAAAQIADICKQFSVDYFCFCSVVRSDKTLKAVVIVYDKNGAKKGNVITKDFDNVRVADKTALLLGKDVAIAIRGPNPIDDIMLEKYNRSYSDIEGKQAELDNVKKVVFELQKQAKAEKKQQQEKADEAKKQIAKPATPAPKAPAATPKDNKK